MSRAAFMLFVEAGADVDWVRNWPNDPGDIEILQVAREEHRVLVTFDKEFGEVSIRDALPPCGIIRLHDIGSKSQGKLVLLAVQEYAQILSAEGVVILSPGRIRVRP